MIADWSYARAASLALPNVPRKVRLEPIVIDEQKDDSPLWRTPMYFRTFLGDFFLLFLLFLLDLLDLLDLLGLRFLTDLDGVFFSLCILVARFFFPPDDII